MTFVYSSLWSNTRKLFDNVYTDKGWYLCDKSNAANTGKNKE